MATLTTEAKTAASLLQKLQKVQQEMKAPKNLYNKFGGYSYRSAEGILEAFKPYGEKYGMALIISDELKEAGGFVYIQATATIYDTETGASMSNQAAAREATEKKGMDASQISGTASSYARKYALNGLLLLDDTKDADTDEFHQQTTRTEKTGGITPQQLGKIKAEMLRTGVQEAAICKRYGAAKLEELTAEQAEAAIKCLGKS